MRKIQSEKINGAAINTATYDVGKVGLAFRFSGQNQHIAIPDSDLWAFGVSDFTIELWANWSFNSGIQTLIANDGGSGSVDKWVFWFDNGGLRFFIHSDSGDYDIISPSFNPEQNKWYHIAFTRNGNDFIFYVNGVPIFTNTVVCSIPNVNAQLTIGACEDSFYFLGMMDEVSIYNRALTENEIRAIYEAGSYGKYKQAAPAGSVPYFTDFETTIGNEWSGLTLDNSYPSIFTKFAGRYGNNSVTLTVTNLEVGEKYILSFDFYAIDSWDGSSTSYGPDYFNVTIQSNRVFRHTFSSIGANQSYPEIPDETGSYGFTSSYSDAIYRNVEIIFVASNTYASITFQGENLSSLSDESWGIDNVNVIKFSDIVPGFVRNTTLPSNGTTNVTALDNFQIVGSRDLLTSTATNANAYSLKSAGPNGFLGDGDDVEISLLPTNSGNRIVNFAFLGSPLQPGYYRFMTLSGLKDVYSNSIAGVTRYFKIENPINGTIENINNDGPNLATLLNPIETPPGKGFYTCFGLGTFSSTSDVDYWMFTAQKGDVVTIRLEGSSTAYTPTIYLELQNDVNTVISSASGNYGLAQIQNCTLPQAGVFYVKVRSSNQLGIYKLRIDISRGPQMESEDNNSQSSANSISFIATNQTYHGRVVVSLVAGDTGDYYKLPYLTVGNSIIATLFLPEGSSLNVSNVVITVELEGSSVASYTNTSDSLSYEVMNNRIHYLKISTLQTDIRAQYYLEIEILDPVKPIITSTTLPLEGTTTRDLIDRFSLSFSEYMNISVVTNSSNYILQTTGGVQYNVICLGYSGGLSAEYKIVDGPLQPGSYVFRVKTNLTDLIGNNMQNEYVRNFTIEGVSGYINENRQNDSFASATALSQYITNRNDGSFVISGSYSVGAYPQAIVSGYIDGDTNLDVVVANLSGGNISVLLGSGDGVFGQATNYSTGDGSISVAIGDVNQDGVNDVVVANHYAHNVRVMLGVGDGSFVAGSVYTVGNNPYWVELEDINGDGKRDIITANYGSQNVSVILGNGDGTFGGRVDYVAGGNAEGVCVVDFDGDGDKDLVVPVYNQQMVRLMSGDGVGGFSYHSELLVGGYCRFVRYGDVNGDGKVDIVALNSSGNKVVIFYGEGGGDFSGRVEYGINSSDPYQLVLGDMNGDGRLDVVIPSYGNSRLIVMLQRWDGTFELGSDYSVSGNPISVTFGDFNSDGIIDLATANYYGNNITVLWGNKFINFYVDENSSIRSATGRGRLYDTSDEDYWSFSGREGEACIIAVDTVGNPYNSSLYCTVYKPDGSQLTSFSTDSRGWGQSTGLILPQSGRYGIRISYNNDYRGEYRVKAILAPYPTQAEKESNDSISQANSLTFQTTNLRQNASVLGMLNVGDSSGDFYKLGNQSYGTTIKLGLRQSAEYKFPSIMAIYNSAGALIVGNKYPTTNLIYEIPQGGDSFFYARIQSGQVGYLPVESRALRLNASADCVNVPDNSLLDFGTNDFKSEIWIFVPALALANNTDYGLLNKSSTYENSSGWGMQVTTAGNIHPNFKIRLFNTGQPTWGQSVAESELLSPNKWYHIAGVRTNGVFLLYVNGILSASNSAPQVALNVDNNQPLLIGDNPWNYAFRGVIADVRLWRRALNSEEIQTNMMTGLAGDEQGLAGNWKLNSSSGTIAPDSSVNSINGSLSGSPTWIDVAPSSYIMPGINAQYVLDIEIADMRPPFITGDTLPLESSTNTTLFDRFTINFSEDMMASTINNLANYSMRCAGVDGDFGTGDDIPYTISITTYSSGLSASYFITDGPLQPGIYKFIINSNISDKAGNIMGTNFVRIFTIENIAGYVMESRNNNTFSTATSIALTPSNLFDGSFASVRSYSVGNNPQFITSGYFNNDTNIDLVTANYSGDNISILLGNGDGTFQSGVNYQTGDGPLAIVVCDMNKDGVVDIAVANYLSSNIRILHGNGDGTFQIMGTYSTGARPYFITAKDVNNDERVDLITANYDGDSVSGLIGNGDGTFQNAIHYASGDGTACVIVEDINADSKQDLISVNYYEHNIVVRYGNGDGTFGERLYYTTGSNPRMIKMYDVNNDGKNDMVTLNSGNNTIGVFIGYGDGTFDMRREYSIGSSDPYQFSVADINNDGYKDIIVPSYGNNQVIILINNGDGTFGSPFKYLNSGNPISITTGDFDSDERMDFAVANYSAHTITLWLGNLSQYLSEDPAGSGIRHGYVRGKLFDNQDVDYYSFSGVAGEKIVIAVETVGSPSSSSLYYALYGPNNSVLVDFYSNTYGNGQLTAYTLPVRGRYAIRVSPNNNYQGEYRVHVITVPQDYQIEAEDNNSRSQANTISFKETASKFSAKILACLGKADTSGDYYRLGYLVAGTTVKIDVNNPIRNRVLTGVEIINNSGSVVSWIPALDKTNLTWTVPAGADGDYFARVYYSGSISTLTFSGNSGYALRFDGNDDIVSFSGGIIPSTGDFTVEVWAYGENWDGYREILSQGTAGNAFYIGYNSDDKLRAGDGWSTIAFNFPFYTWSHLAVVKTSNNTYYYLNGDLIATKGSAIPNPSQTGAFLLGKQYGSYSEYWPGYIDEVRIWNVARTEEEIRQNMTNYLAGTESGLVAYWRCDEGAGYTLTDLSGNNRNGTLANGVVFAPSPTGSFVPLGIEAVYILNIEIINTQQPFITGSTLPAMNSTSSALLDRFDITFNTELSSSFNMLSRIKSYGGHNYISTETTMTWLNAELYARSIGGHLVTINDLAENEFIRANYASSSSVWIGLNDELKEGQFVWVSGEPVTFTRWNSGEPNNSGDEDYVQMYTSGYWNDVSGSSIFRGVVEIFGFDSDNDGIANVIDPYPNDRFNGFDLRSAGNDGLFDTEDDEVYGLLIGNYTGGKTISFSVTDGPLQPGNYRFIVTSSIKDRFLNSVVPYVNYFVVTNIVGITGENRVNNTREIATPLVFTEDPAGLKWAFGRGNLFNSGDVDYWSFDGQSNEIVMLACDIPGNPSGSSLYYRIENSSGIVLREFNAEYYGRGQSAPYVIPTNGTYYVRVSPNYNYNGEYRIRVSIGSSTVQMETEDNNSISSANIITLRESGDGKVANMAGYVRVSDDIDYFNIGEITNGSTVFILVRQPANSYFQPVVGLYNVSEAYMAESGVSRPNDGVAEVRISQTGTYYVKLRTVSGLYGLSEQYVLDIQVLPSGSVNFPNLIVNNITVPSGPGILSGKPITISYTVSNIGSAPTDVSTWYDRIVLSGNQIYGDSDDTALAVVQHQGILNPSNEYTVTNILILPDGISGTYYTFVIADVYNAVNEIVMEGDNLLCSSGIEITISPYPDLRVENLTVIPPQSGTVYGISWLTKNHGNAPVQTSFRERLIVRNNNSGTVLINTERTITNVIGISETISNYHAVAVPSAGSYTVSVTTDSRNEIYEYDESGHASAEINTWTTNFNVVRMFNVFVYANPTEGGVVSGGGQFISGSTVTVNAVPNTNIMPYRFISWTEDGVFQSANSTYAFTLIKYRNLVANFGLPSYQVFASNNPSMGGTITGDGTYVYGTTNTLFAKQSAGYLFSHWSNTNGVVIGTSTQLVVIVTNTISVVANYAEANPFHVVTTGTMPSNIATVSGAGIYSNNQTATISAPSSITNPPVIYRFKEFTLNGQYVGSSPTIIKTFTTLDPTNVIYTAKYDTITIAPIITNVLVNFTNPVPLTTNFLIAFQFNRGMKTNITPSVFITNESSGVRLTVSQDGFWTNRATAGDTYFAPSINILPGMDGTWMVNVSGAQDVEGSPMEQTNAVALVIDATPPPHPVLTISSSNSYSVTVTWNDYANPSDLSGFRVNLATTNYNSISGLNMLTRLSASARSYTYSGLSLDIPYYTAIAAVDVAGNCNPNVTTLHFILSSTVPPPVGLTSRAPTANSAEVLWGSYSTANLFGFSGFRLYYEETNFSTVVGLIPKQTLPTGARSAVITGLDRQKTYFFAVVGFNKNNEFNPTVNTVSWTDPYSGNITNDLTIGGVGQTIIIYNTINIVNGANLTIQPGTVIQFHSGAGLIVEQGRLIANGTALDPIIFTSVNDITGGNPVPGSWSGITLKQGAGDSLLKHVFINYGNGLVIDGCLPTLEAITLLYNSPFGMNVKNGAVVNSSDALISYNTVGLLQNDSARITLTNSVIKNNITNAVNSGSNTLVVTDNWWGSTDPSDITRLIIGDVSYFNYLGYEPLLTPALRLSNNVTQVGSRLVNLQLACRTAESMRISEDSTFKGVPFQEFVKSTTFQLSEGGGQKTIYAQFRNVTGNTNTPVSVSVNYITDGPAITSFNLTEGITLRRPFIVSASVTATLGIQNMEFYVDNVLHSAVQTGSFSQRLDIRNYENGVHRVKILARDTAGNIATLEKNIIISAEPPPAPAITSPPSGIIVTSNSVNILGTAEALIALQIIRNGVIVGNGQANSNGNFEFPNIPLVEGQNDFVAVALDEIGSSRGPSCIIVRDTGAPAPLILNEPAYSPRDGLYLTWMFSPSGERASRFSLFWHTEQFADPSVAIGRVTNLTRMEYYLKNIPEGDYYIGVVGYDEAGNASELSNLIRYHYDPVPPSLTIRFDKQSPVGVGPVKVTLMASEPLRTTPSMTVKFGSSAPIMVSLTRQEGLNNYEATINVNPFTPSGRVEFRASCMDIAGNTFEGGPTGDILVVDVIPPTGAIQISGVPPIQVTNEVEISVNLKLSEPAKMGTTPVLTFRPPIGTNVNIELSGADTNWNGVLRLYPDMGSGLGAFNLDVSDQLDNVGHVITSGAFLEIYNTALPSPPSAPTNLRATSRPGGFIILTWNAVTNAEVYRVYSEAGTNPVAPKVLIADGLTTTTYTDLPPEDGYFRYMITALRRGAESAGSGIYATISDRTPPAKPTNLVVQMTITGVRITWEKGEGDTPYVYKIYRNGNVIRTVPIPTIVDDAPPRGINTYIIGAADYIGNESFSEPVEYLQTVGPVDSFSALIVEGSPPELTWGSNDPEAAGFNIYRNGVKQNEQPLSIKRYIDPFAIGNEPVTYEVRIVNATNAEGPSRTIQVYPISMEVVSGYGITNEPLTTHYFDAFTTKFTNNSTASIWQVDRVELHRVINGKETVIRTVNGPFIINSGSGIARSIIFPSSTEKLSQNVLMKIIQRSESQTSVVYQKTNLFTQYKPPGVLIEMSALEPPISGGYGAFDLRIHNRGMTPIDVVLVKNQGNDPGDLYVAVINTLGQEVSRTYYHGMPQDMAFGADGRGYIRISPNGSYRLQFTNVFIPAALGTNATYFEAVITNIYYQIATSEQQVSGPLNGSVICSLTQTPYYGTSQTDKTLYANDEPIIISGKAIDRMTGQPVPNVPLKIGFYILGYRLEKQVITDENGNYCLINQMQRGIAGTVKIWGAHPDVYDVLNQSEIRIYRIYTTPQVFNIRMSKNSVVNFSAKIVNPGELPLSNFSYEFNAFTMEGTNKIPTQKIHGDILYPTNFTVGARDQKSVEFSLSSDEDAPDSAIVEFLIKTGEGASALISGNATLLTPVPILSVIDPSVGYVDMSLNRGDFKSQSVTVINKGLSTLRGVYVIPPTNTGWIFLNNPISEDGLIHLPDIPVGGSNVFTVVFSPPDDTPIEYYQDWFVIGGTNAPGTRKINVYALVTSSLRGNVKFYVDNILTYPVPNATVRIKNIILNQEFSAATDIDGNTTITNLQEGDWSWQVTAPGHSPMSGVVTIIPEQTQLMSVRLSRRLVTVNFTVEPVPFTDKYDIKIEQTFETHVPAPVLVVSPPFIRYENVGPGWEATFIATVFNPGLIQLNDLVINGSTLKDSSVTPLIEYLPVLLPQEQVEIPFRCVYNGPIPGQEKSSNIYRNDFGRDFDAEGFADCVTGGLKGLAEFVVNINSIVNHLSQFYADGQCADMLAALRVFAAVAVAYSLLAAPSFSPLGFLPSPFPSPGFVVMFFINLASCITQQFIGPSFGEGVGDGGGGKAGYGSGFGYGMSSPVCFVRNTSILMADGSQKPIQMVKPNDWVKTGHQSWQKASVKEVTERICSDLYRIEFVDKNSQSFKSVTATGDHAFWVDGEGWTYARSLRVGQWLMNSQGEDVTIAKIERINLPERVYSLILREDQAFYANGVLVRDRCGLPHDGAIQTIMSEQSKQHLQSNTEK